MAPRKNQETAAAPKATSGRKTASRGKAGNSAPTNARRSKADKGAGQARSPRRSATATDAAAPQTTEASTEAKSETANVTRPMFSLPNRFQAISMPVQELTHFKDLETGKEIWVASAAVGEIRRLLGCFFGGMEEGQDSYVPTGPIAAPTDEKIAEAESDMRRHFGDLGSAQEAEPPAAKGKGGRGRGKAASPTLVAVQSEPEEKASPAAAEDAASAPAPKKRGRKSAAEKAAALEAAAASEQTAAPEQQAAAPAVEEAPVKRKPGRPKKNAAAPEAAAPAPAKASSKSNGDGKGQGQDRVASEFDPKLRDRYEGEGYVMEFNVVDDKPAYVILQGKAKVGNVTMVEDGKWAVSVDQGGFPQTKHKTILGAVSRVDVVLNEMNRVH